MGEEGSPTEEDMEHEETSYTKRITKSRIRFVSETDLVPFSSLEQGEFFENIRSRRKLKLEGEMDMDSLTEFLVREVVDKDSENEWQRSQNEETSSGSLGDNFLLKENLIFGENNLRSKKCGPTFAFDEEEGYQEYRDESVTD